MVFYDRVNGSKSYSYSWLIISQVMMVFYDRVNGSKSYSYSWLIIFAGDDGVLWSSERL